MRQWAAASLCALLPIILARRNGRPQQGGKRSPATRRGCLDQAGSHGGDAAPQRSVVMRGGAALRGQLVARQELHNNSNVPQEASHAADACKMNGWRGGEGRVELQGDWAVVDATQGAHCSAGSKANSPEVGGEASSAACTVPTGARTCVIALQLPYFGHRGCARQHQQRQRVAQHAAPLHLHFDAACESRGDCGALLSSWARLMGQEPRQLCLHAWQACQQAKSRAPCHVPEAVRCKSCAHLAARQAA